MVRRIARVLAVGVALAVTGVGAGMLWNVSQDYRTAVERCGG